MLNSIIMGTQSENQKPNFVFGRVTNTLDRPLKHFLVHIYDRDLRSEELLAETITNNNGEYEVKWFHSQLSGRGKKEADLSLKIFTRDKKLIFSSTMDMIRFNASSREEINIIVENSIEIEEIEYNHLLREVTYLINKIAIVDLKEDKEHQDITFLSKEMEVPSEKIEHLVISHRIQKLSSADPAFFYALFRENTLLNNDLTQWMGTRFSIDITTDIRPLLYSAALTEVKVIQKAIEKAVNKRIVGANVKKEWKQNVEILQRYRKEAEEYYKHEHPKKVINTITNWITDDKFKEMGQLFDENKNDLSVFFEKITDPSFLNNDTNAALRKDSSVLEQLFDKELIPFIIESKKIKNEKDVRRLAKLNKTDWVEELKKSKDTIKHLNNKQAIHSLASSIVRKMEKQFPTTAFTAQLEREKKTVVKNQDKIVFFLKENEDFDFTKDSVDLFLNERHVRKNDAEAIREELKSIQRVFKLIPHYAKSNALRKQNIHSAQSIVATGETRFVKEIAPKAGIKLKEAKAIYKNAVNINVASMLVVGELQDTMRGMDIAALETSALEKKLEAVSKDFPNLKSLFKLTDTCTCEHCRSVYSPAAYFVEILQFLDKRSVSDLTVTPPTISNIAKDVLFERRPDLGDIDLSCENSNTPLKYIDLVCELLEESIAPDPGISYSGNLSSGSDPLKGKIAATLLSTLQTAGLPVTDRALIFETEVSSGSSAALPHYLRDQKVVCKIIGTGGSNYKIFRLRQTLSPANELAAAPEYVNKKAYDKLATESFAFKLPFDLNHVEAKAYFNRFDVSRSQLMEQFQSGGIPANGAIAAENLGLTNSERNLITVPKVSLGDQQTVWNAPAQWDTPAVAGTVVDYMKRVDHFLDKTGLSYKELDLLLTLKFIDPTSVIYIKNLDLTCDTQQKEIANLTEAALDRIHRFLRLQKKTGWKFEVLDAIISQSKLGNGTLDNDCLISASYLKNIAEKTGIKIDELIGFYGDIPHIYQHIDGPTPLYQQLFLNKAKNGFIESGLSPEKIDGSQLLATYTTVLATCLQLKKQDFEKLLPLLTTSNLTFSNLSFLLASARLLKKLKLKTDDFIQLIDLTNSTFTDSPKKTFEFILEVEGFSKSPLKVPDVKLMLHHQALILPDINEKIKQILEKLQKEYQANFLLNKSRFNDTLTADEQKETLQNALSGLIGISEEDVKIFLAFIDKNWPSAVYAKNFTDSKLGNLFNTTSIKNKIDELESAAATKAQDIADYEAALLQLRAAQDTLKTADNPAEVTAANLLIAAAEAQILAALPKYLIASGKNLVKAFLDSIAAYQLEAGKQLILEVTLTTAFKTDPEMMKVLLNYAQLKQAGPGSDYLSVLLKSDTLIDTNPAHTIPVLPLITPGAFLHQYSSLKLMNKLIPLISAFGISTHEIAWYFENNKDLGWFEWYNIPYDIGQTDIDYASYIAFAGMIDLSKKFPPVVNPADAENPVSLLTIAAMLLTGSSVTRNELITSISHLTGYEISDIDSLDAYFFPIFDLNHYREVETWYRLLDAAESLHKLGTDISQVVQYIKPVLLANDVSLLRTALKSRYDEDTWLGTLKEIMDAIRPQKRDALVAYVLAVNPEMKDENDLFDYLLVDVQMESCMPSSRIVQAHGTIQLFVQRCLMGLEPKAAADLDNDSNWNQWKWMKNYRVWEANRKVFLYPENWIEPELRDDKSFLFTELENEMQQNEMSEITAEQAFINYLEKLDNIAFLEVMATWYQTDIKTMHVFARTKGGDPAIYYYRKFEQERYWTPWEKVELDISGDQLLAFERNNRLCLAWPVFSEEPDQNQKATIPASTANTSVDVDKPKRKLKIQLAISEFANKKWQPKKISKQGILTPSNFTTEVLSREKYNMLYFEMAQQIWFFSTNLDNGNEYHQLNGIFNLTGCKGYPELVFQGNKYFADFFPDFKDTLLKSQRYNELNNIAGDELTVRNGVSLFQFYEILHTTPGNFRLSYPLQFTKIDLIVLLFEYLLIQVFKGNLSDRRIGLKIPLGTLLPYFMEDSNHAYVIIPGFYKVERDRETKDLISVKRTGSNVMQLIEDIIALFSKYMAKYQADPAHDTNALIQELIADPDYQEMIQELGIYKTLKYGEQFKNMYHPLICPLRKTLYKNGIPELMKRETQLQKTAFNFKTYYDPNVQIVAPLVLKKEDGTNYLTFPIEDLDFSSDGSYSCYNWELFFHAPLLIATRLSQNQKFEEALTWFHYMFNPTGALSGNTAQKYWVTKPFFLNQDADYINQRIDTLLYKIAAPSTPERAELEFAISEWRSKPFKPDVVARFRPVAYQKALIMKYIDNLTEWGDYLFRQDTMESIVQATQMYILADKLLGPKPRIIPPTVKAPYETYNQVENKLDSFGNALIELENILPDLSVLPEGGNELPPPPLTLSMLYFCIPQNDKMLQYWGKVEDRLFKIRHCQNIDGIERSLALFAPPIDSAMLVRAAASGLDISDVMAGLNAPAPYYRFNILSQKATELAQEVRGLGSLLLQTLEKKDAEALLLLRSELEINLQNAIKDIKTLQIEESKEEIEILKKTKKVTEERENFYAAIEKIISKEQLNLDKLKEANDYLTASQIVRTVAGALALIPEFHIGASGFGGSPHVVMQLGGSAMSKATAIGADILNILSSVASYEANRASITAGQERRFDDWKLQERLAKKELAVIEKQITAAEIRREISQMDLRNHELQIENLKKTDEFMRSKFTNKQLYNWMIGQVSSVYFSAYKLSYDFAKKAERSYQFELGNNDTFISYGYWDSMKKGLQSADRLIHDIKRMETSYIDKNKREYEIIKQISLSMLDPLALVRLRATGVCDFEIPEVLFDMDYAGQYFRRIKSVSITLPCIVGPYTSIAAKLSLVSNRYRKNTIPDNLAATGYQEDPGNDERFVYNIGAIQSIATSTAQNDSGVFELNFRDERYLPFEGTGTISNWRLELPAEAKQFDYNTISDVVIHMKYTAREGGSGLKNLANTSLKDRLALIQQQLSQEGLHIAINLKHDLPNEWFTLKKNGSVALTIDKFRLPYMAQTLDAAIEDVFFIAKIKNNPAAFALTIDGSVFNLSRINEWKLCRGTNSNIELDTAFNLAVALPQIDNLEEIILLVKYRF